MMKKRGLVFLIILVTLLMIGCGQHEHKWESDWTVDKEATCTEEGSKSHHCSGCNEITDITIIEAFGHDYGEWETVVAPTEKATGKKERVCQNCNQIESEIIPVLEHEHTYSSEWDYDEDWHYHKSTCEHELIKNKGSHLFTEEILDKSKKYVCSVCGYSYTISTKITKSSKWAEAVNNLKNYTLFVDENTYIKYTGDCLEYKMKYKMQIGSIVYEEMIKMVYTKEDELYACYVYEKYVGRWLKEIYYEDELGLEESILNLVANGYTNATFDKKTQSYVVSVEEDGLVYRFTLGFEDGEIKSGQIECLYGDNIKETYIIKDIGTTTVEIPEYTPTEQDIWENAFNERYMRNFTMTLTIPSGIYTYKSAYVDGNHIVEIVGGYTEIYVKTKEGRYFKYQNDSDSNWKMEEITDEDSIAELEYWTFSYIRLCPDFGYYFDEFVYNKNTGLYVFRGIEGENEIKTNAPGALVYAYYNLVLVEIKDGKLIRVEAQISNQSVNNACRVAFSDYDTTIIELPKEYEVIK